MRDHTNIIHLHVFHLEEVLSSMRPTSESSLVCRSYQIKLRILRHFLYAITQPLLMTLQRQYLATSPFSAVHTISLSSDQCIILQHLITLFFGHKRPLHLYRGQEEDPIYIYTFTRVWSGQFYVCDSRKG